MSVYVLFDRATTEKVGSFATLKAARTALRAANRRRGLERMSRNWNGTSEWEWCRNVETGEILDGPFGVADAAAYRKYVVTTKKVVNLMTGKEVEIASDTPWSCNPASETYWSM